MLESALLTECRTLILRSFSVHIKQQEVARVAHALLFSADNTPSQTLLIMLSMPASKCLKVGIRSYALHVASK